MKDKKLRLEDAINATRAAVEEGIVPGGGATLAHLSENVLTWAKINLKEDELIGAMIISRAIQAPLKSCLLYTSPSPRDRQKSRMPSSA